MEAPGRHDSSVRPVPAYSAHRAVPTAGQIDAFLSFGRCSLFTLAPMLAPVTDDTLGKLRSLHGPDLSLAHLVDAGVDQLPMPGTGRTLARWRVLAEVAAHDLSLVKLFEGHTDALAILGELGAEAVPPGNRWATWCAEPPNARVRMEHADDQADERRVRLHGVKAWCSGAAQATHAVLSGWNAQGEPCLAALDLKQEGVRVTDEGWQAVGMAASASVDVHLDGAMATLVGQPGDYVRRPGFWQGGAGIAACWFGGALGIARMTKDMSGAAPDPHRLAHLGAIDVAMTSASAVLHEAAAWIDRNPQADARGVAWRARLVVEQCATEVVSRAGRALGAGPLCRNQRFARAMADLPVFLRQSHAERDLASLGQWVLGAEGASWSL